MVHAVAWLCWLACATPGDASADVVLGQSSFNANMPNAPGGLPSAAGLQLSNAAHVAIAPSGRLYVADADNHRVLSWPSVAALTNGQPADRVFGQPDFVSATPNHGGISGASLCLPQGLCADESGHLWVADAFNHRVLKFNDPDSDATPTVADLVVGQPNLHSNLENLGQGGSGPDVALPDSLQFPGRVLVRGGHLWIADSGNSRVLHYPLPSANKPLADRVVGQFGNLFKRAKNNDGAGQNGCCPSADNLLNPIGLALDAGGRLYVADWGNHRVLRFDDPLASDMTADGVYGQPDFVSGIFDNGGPTLGMQLPIDVAFDAAGGLLVADSGNHRVLRFARPLIDALPHAVLGQLGSLSNDLPNHGLGPTATDADGLFGPTGVAADAADDVLVVDTNNHRVLRYDQPFVVRGDINCDGVLDAADAAALALALSDPAGFVATYPGCPVGRADLSGDGSVDGRDIQPFVALRVSP